MKFSRTLLAAVGGFALLGCQAEAFAQAFPGGVIVLAPAAVSVSVQAVPTLSEWGVAGLAVLLAVVAYRYLRANLGGKPLASFFLAAALGVCGVLGDQVIRQAAAAIATLTITNPAGGSFQICNSITSVLNNSSGTLQVISITPDVGAGSGLGVGTCAPGFVLPPAAACTVSFVGNSNFCAAQ